jgi:hypothetical protein
MAALIFQAAQTAKPPADVGPLFLTVPPRIEAGLEKAPIGVVTTPGTKNPKYRRFGIFIHLARPQPAIATK